MIGPDPRERDLLRGLIRLRLPLTCAEAARAHSLRVAQDRPGEWAAGYPPLPDEDTWTVYPPVVEPWPLPWGIEANRERFPQGHTGRFPQGRTSRLPEDAGA
jgi:hypothetical protein